MKRLTIIIAITMTSGALVWVLGQTDLKKYAASFFTKPQSTSRYAVKKPTGNLMRPSQPTSTYSVPLSTAQVSTLASNRVVILMDAKGELPGALTLTLERDAAGTTVVGGSWALVVSYTDLTPNADGGGEAVSEALVQKGTLSGTIVGGSMTVDANGNILSVDSVQLSIDQGSVAYDGVTGGTGSAQETNLQDTPSSSGSLILNF